MFRKIAVVACVMAVAGFAAPAMAGGCPGCDKVKESGEGFCDHCGQGMTMGIKLASAKLYHALTGEKVDEGNMHKCCKSAMKSNGQCCGKSYANGKAYKSPMAYTLAKGKPVKAEKAAKCDGCMEAYKSNGFCKGCDVGIVAHRMFKGKDGYKAAKAAHKALQKASEYKCEGCAVAMVSDGSCDHCKTVFKDGKLVKGKSHDHGHGHGHDHG